MDTIFMIVNVKKMSFSGISSKIKSSIFESACDYVYVTNRLNSLQNVIFFDRGGTYRDIPERLTQITNK